MTDKRILAAPLRLLLGLAFLLVAVVAREILLLPVRWLLSLRDPPAIWLGPEGGNYGPRGILYALVAAAFMVFLGYWSYRLYVKWVERRALDELALQGALREGALGALLGAAFVLFLAAVLWMGGHYSLLGSNPWPWALPLSAAAATAAFIEELAVRGLLFRITEERLGTWAALFLTSLIFGLMHAANAHANWLSMVCIALSAGPVAASAYVLTRRLWLPIGLHFGVNLTEGAVLGLAVSGAQARGLLRSQLTGPAYLTGGAFGLEASMIVPALGVGMAAVFLVMAAHRGQIRPPRWRRREAA
ncbi:MAG TPA: type II CAAX endopeptidase family protein [Thermoanaerobaculia bacterium]|nr:type II CAAX endopeptidase family protein [Thermoanaerobaculia bacterium]